ncbi:MAG: hypothetical protein AAF674_19715 [Pseudomonadota bacterium]
MADVAQGWTVLHLSVPDEATAITVARGIWTTREMSDVLWPVDDDGNDVLLTELPPIGRSNFLGLNVALKIIGQGAETYGTGVFETVADPESGTSYPRETKATDPTFRVMVGLHNAPRTVLDALAVQLGPALMDSATLDARDGRGLHNWGAGATLYHRLEGAGNDAPV